jgi:hypothetical protein
MTDGDEGDREYREAVRHEILLLVLNIAYMTPLVSVDPETSDTVYAPELAAALKQVEDAVSVALRLPPMAL